MSLNKIEERGEQSPRAKAIQRKKWDKANRTDEQVSLSQLNISDDKENHTKESLMLPSVYLKNENKDASVNGAVSTTDEIFNEEIS